MENTQGAIRAAEVITDCEYENKRRRWKTAYGTKTVRGIAAVIERETKLPELLAQNQKLKKALEYAFIQMGLHGANHDLDSPYRQAWEKAREALAV